MIITIIAAAAAVVVVTSAIIIHGLHLRSVVEVLVSCKVLFFSLKFQDSQHLKTYQELINLKKIFVLHSTNTSKEGKKKKKEKKSSLHFNLGEEKSPKLSFLV